MKMIPVLFLAMFITVCGSNSITNGQQITDFLLKNSSELIGRDKEVIDGIRKNMIESRSHSSDKILFTEVFVNEDDYIIKSMPCYELDTDKFMEDPQEERIPECLHISENALAFIVEAKTGELYHLMADKDIDSEIWLPKLFIEDLRSKYSWLKTESEKTDSGDYTLLTFLGRQFFILQFDGKPVFYDMLGRKGGKEKSVNLLLRSLKTKRMPKVTGT